MYRVHYAGEADDALLLRARSAEEAAFLFFSNQPDRKTLIVEQQWRLEKEITYDQLAQLRPEAPSILARSAGKKGLVMELLALEHGAKQAREVDAAHDAEQARRMKQGLIQMIPIAIAFAIIMFLLKR